MVTVVNATPKSKHVTTQQPLALYNDAAITHLQARRGLRPGASVFANSGWLPAHCSQLIAHS